MRVVTNTFILILIFLFLVKHFIADFLLQTPYQFQNKHIWMHPGGIIHASLHIGATLMILGPLCGFTFDVILLSILEGILHYVIDWGKTNLNIKYNLQYNNSQFWYMLGLDQLLHQLTYVAIIYILM